MAEDFLYRRVAADLRRRILEGELKPGDRVPTVREMTGRWGCTIGTVQRAYRELAQQGLLKSRPGKGTQVVDRVSVEDPSPLRRATLIHRAETFLLEVLMAGYAQADIEEAVRVALDRWRVVQRQPDRSSKRTLRFAGSHDMAIAWIATHFSEIAQAFSLTVSFGGSLSGLIALAEGEADIAGCHLWDEETATFNLPFVRRVMPGKRVALVTLAHRKIGLMVPPGNPRHLAGLPDLVIPGVRFINRQSGSGTRVWLDSALRDRKLDPARIRGYEREKLTHSDVARAIAEGEADVGLGLEAAARAFALTFVALTEERYDLVIPEDKVEGRAVRRLLAWLGSADAIGMISGLAGYDARETGKIVWTD